LACDSIGLEKTFGVAVIDWKHLSGRFESHQEENDMPRLVNIGLAVIGAGSLILLTSTTSSAQKLPKRIHIQATAMGTMTQMGRMFNVNLIIEEVTSDQERAGLLEAFQAKGNEGLQNALEKMHAKGEWRLPEHLAMTLLTLRCLSSPTDQPSYAW
jgi:hypothetical protein